MVFLSLYINSNGFYQQCDARIYIPKEKEASEDNTSSLKESVLSDNISSKGNQSKKLSKKKFKKLKNKTSSSKLSTKFNTISSKNPEESSADTTTSTISSDDYYNKTISTAEIPNIPTYSSSETSSFASSTTSSTQSSSSTSSETSSETSSTTSSSTSSKVIEDSVAKENIQKVGLISETYGVSLTIPSSESDFVSEDILSYSKNPEEIKNQLVEIENSLNTFPKKFFSKTSTEVNFVLVSTTRTNDIIRKDSKIIVPCFNVINPTQINDFLLDISAENLSEKVTLNYENYNPGSFYYDYPYYPTDKYLYKPSQPTKGYFISLKAQKSQEDDLYETFMAIFKNPELLRGVPSYSPYYNKLIYTCKELLKWSDCFNEIPVVNQFSSL